MSNISDDVPIVAIEDVLEWALCPLRVWWREHMDAADFVEPNRPKTTGERLMKNAVRETVTLFYRTAQKHPDKEPQLENAAMAVWQTWLKKWDLLDLLDPLLEYYEKRHRLLTQFTDGKFKRRDGTPYRRPKWTSLWYKAAEKSGMNQLRQSIDRRQVQAGLALAPVDSDDDNVYRDGPVGLAEAFGESLQLLWNLKGTLPAPDAVTAVNGTVWMDALALRVSAQADLIAVTGEKKKKGRPRRGEELETTTKLAFHVFHFDEDPPMVAAMLNDPRLIVLRHGYPEGYSEENAEVEQVVVHHLAAGRSQAFRPREGQGTMYVQSIAWAYYAARQSAAYVPRLAAGWHACGGCEYRSLCYGGEGVMNLFDPPLTEQIDRGHQLYVDLQKFVHQAGRDQEEIKAVMELLRGYTRWLGSVPNANKETVLWILDAIERELLC